MKEKEVKTYIVKNKDFLQRSISRSGGVFPLLAANIVEQKGTVYGCQLDENMSAVHKRAQTKDEYLKFCGSKYVQSRLGNAFFNAKKDLMQGKIVLFTGTSCQIDGLRSFCKDVNTNNLYCLDIVCHGVPSPLILEKYIYYSGLSNQGKVEKFDFRNKSKYGWKQHVESMIINGKVVDSNIYTSLFYRGDIIRDACYKCPYKKITHPSDITLGDAWGVDKASPDFDDDKGVSLVIVNSKKGNELFDSIKDNCYYKECDINEYMQMPLIESYKRPVHRDVFWKDLHRKSWKKLINKYYIGNRIKRFIKKLLRVIK